MAKPTRFPTFRESDLGIKDGPIDGANLREVFRRFASQLNPGLDATNKATAKGLSLADNLRNDIVTATFTHGVAQNLVLKNLSKANSARVLSCDSQIPAAAPAIQMVPLAQSGNKPMAAITVFFNTSMNPDGSPISSKVTLELLEEGSQNSTVPAFVPSTRGFGHNGLVSSSTLAVTAASNTWTDLPGTTCTFTAHSADRSSLAVLTFSGFATGAAGPLQIRFVYGSVLGGPFNLLYNTMNQHQSWVFQNAVSAVLGGAVGAAQTIKAQILSPIGSAAAFNMDANDSISLTVQEVG